MPDSLFLANITTPLSVKVVSVRVTEDLLSEMASITLVYFIYQIIDD